MEKPIHIKPSLYAFYFEKAKTIARGYGYNLVLHGSMARDLDLIAIPWEEETGNVEEMIKEIADEFGGYVLDQNGAPYTTTYHGRMWWIINIRRGGSNALGEYEDAQYYFDISVMPTLKT